MRVFAAGDLVNARSNRSFVSDELAEVIRGCDLSMCNFEAPVSGAGSPRPKTGPLVSQSPDAPQYCRDAGFDLVTIANNHIYDYGDEGLRQTIERLQAAGLRWVGAGCDFQSALAPELVHCQGLTVAVLGACEADFGCFTEQEARYGYAWLNSPALDDEVRRLKGEADVIILQAHCGPEEVDVPLPEWRARLQRLCRLGVDLVFGHHPHVPQGYERLGSCAVFYSLGNLYFDTELFAGDANDSFSVVVEVDSAGVGEIVPVFHKMRGDRTVKVDPDAVSFSLESLNDALGEGYEQRVDELVVELLETRYLPYYRRALSTFSFDEPLVSLSRLARQLRPGRGNRARDDALLLYHNIFIESHRYVVQRALKRLYL